MIDPATGNVPEDPPYASPEGPFDPLSLEAPRMDFVTWDPAWISERLDDPALRAAWPGLRGVDEVSRQARIRSGTNWSGLTKAVFYPPQDLSTLGQVLASRFDWEDALIRRLVAAPTREIMGEFGVNTAAEAHRALGRAGGGRVAEVEVGVHRVVQSGRGAQRAHGKGERHLAHAVVLVRGDEGDRHDARGVGGRGDLHGARGIPEF